MFVCVVGSKKVLLWDARYCDRCILLVSGSLTFYFDGFALSVVFVSFRFQFLSFRVGACGFPFFVCADVFFRLSISDSETVKV